MKNCLFRRHIACTPAPIRNMTPCNVNSGDICRIETNINVILSIYLRNHSNILAKTAGGIFSTFMNHF